MTDTANLSLAVDSNPVVTATRALEGLNQEAAKVPDRVGRLGAASDALVQALNRNTTATDSLSARLTAMEAASAKAAASVGQLGSETQQATNNVVQFTGASRQAQGALEGQAQAASKAAVSWGNLGQQAADALRKITAARAAMAAPPPPPPPPPPAPPVVPPQRTPTMWDRLGPAGAAQNYNLTPQGAAELRMRSLSSDGAVPASAAAQRNMQGRMAPYQLQNLFYQGSDAAVTLAMGMNPLMVGLQQGPQIAQSFMGPGAGTLGGLASQGAEAVTKLATRIGVMGGAMLGAAAAVGTLAAAGMSYASTQTALARQLAGAGRASGATLADVNAIAAEGGGGLSTRARRDYAGQFAGTGLIGPSMYSGILGTVRDYATTTGQDQKEAVQQLAAAFADPARGAETLNKQLGFLNASTQENIQRLSAQGDRLGAQNALLAAYSASLTKASENTSGWGKISENVLVPLINLWDRLGQAVDRATTGGSLDDRIAEAQARLEIMNNGPTGFLDAIGLGGPRQSLQAEIDKMIEQRNRQLRQADNARSGAQSIQLKRDLDSINPLSKSIEDLEDKAKAIRRPFTENWIDPFGAAKIAIDAIAVQTKQMRTDMEAGGAAYADSLRSAQFQVRTATMGPESMSVAQIEEQANTKRIQAMREAANNPNIEEAKSAYEVRLRSIEQETELLKQAQQARVVNQGANGGGRYRITLAQVPTQYRDAVYQSAIQNNLNPDLLASQIYTESRFNPNAVSPAGAQGIAQFMPPTARAMGLTNPFDPMASIAAMGRHMRQLMDEYGNDETSALVGYNAGVSTRRRFQASGRDVSVLPDETRGYVRTITTPEPTAASRIQEAENSRRSLKLEEDQLKATTAAGGENTAQLRAQQETLRLVSDAQGRNITVSKELEAQYSAEARARENLRMAGQFQTFIANDNFAREQLGRSREDQAAYAAARPYAGTDYYNQVLGRTQETNSLTEAKQMVTDGATSFVTALRRGASASDALANAFGSAADKLLNKAIDSLVSNAFGMMGGGNSGGGLGFLSSIFGGAAGGGSPTGGVRLFDTGGYTGPGGRHEPAGVVHKGEVVWSQSDVARYGGAAVVNRMRLGYPGYADGGVVGVGQAAMAANTNTFLSPIQVNMQGSSGDSAKDRAYIDTVMSELRQEMQSTARGEIHSSLETNGALWKAGVRRSAA